MEMKIARESVIHFVADESGQDLIEYALVTALLGLGAILSIKTLSTRIGTAFTSIGTTLTTNV
jgi:pilus assembly protein Flp/PilA